MACTPPSGAEHATTSSHRFPIRRQIPDRRADLGPERWLVQRRCCRRPERWLVQFHCCHRPERRLVSRPGFRGRSVPPRSPEKPPARLAGQHCAGPGCAAGPAHGFCGGDRPGGRFAFGARRMHPQGLYQWRPRARPVRVRLMSSQIATLLGAHPIEGASARGATCCPSAGSISHASSRCEPARDLRVGEPGDRAAGRRGRAGPAPRAGRRLQQPAR